MNDIREGESEWDDPASNELITFELRSGHRWQLYKFAAIAVFSFLIATTAFLSLLFGVGNEIAGIGLTVGFFVGSLLLAIRVVLELSVFRFDQQKIVGENPILGRRCLRWDDVRSVREFPSWECIVLRGDRLTDSLVVFWTFRNLFSLQQWIAQRFGEDRLEASLTQGGIQRAVLPHRRRFFPSLFVVIVFVVVTPFLPYLFEDEPLSKQLLVMIGFPALAVTFAVIHSEAVVTEEHLELRALLPWFNRTIPWRSIRHADLITEVVNNQTLFKMRLQFVGRSKPVDFTGKNRKTLAIFAAIVKAVTHYAQRTGRDVHELMAPDLAYLAEGMMAEREDQT